MAVVVAHDGLLVLTLDLGVLGEMDVHDLLVGGKDRNPSSGMVRAGDHPLGALWRLWAPLLSAAVVVVEVCREPGGACVCPQAEQPPASVVDIDVAVADLQAEGVVVLETLQDRPQDAFPELALELRADAAPVLRLDHAVERGDADEVLVHSISPLVGPMETVLS